MTSSNHSKDMQRGNRTPTRGGKTSTGGYNKSPQARDVNLSPFRARLMQTKRQTEQQTGRTPERNRMRQQQSSRSPLRR